jgi:hypothetical protein
MVGAARPADHGPVTTAIRRLAGPRLTPLEEKITWVAVLAPLPYSLHRLIWAFGIPLGIHPDGLHDFLQSPGLGSLGLLVMVALTEGTAAFTYLFVLTEQRTLPDRIPLVGGKRMPPWLVIPPLLAPVGILATFNHWSLQYIFDGFTMPGEVAEGIPGWSFWTQVAIFWIWGVSLTIAIAAYAVRACRRVRRRPVAGDGALGEDLSR